MKKLVMLLAVATVFVACGNPGYVKENAATCDTCVVEDSLTEELAIDSMSIDTTSIDTVSE